MQLLRRWVRQALEHRGHILVPKAQWEDAFGTWPGRVYGPEPDERQQQVLRLEAPELVDLRARYDRLDVDATAHSLWQANYVETRVNLQRFRDHSAYVWVYRELPRATQLKYFIYAQDVNQRCSNVLQSLEEDGAFGCLCYDFESFGRVSRDRLDSALEIDFLERHLGPSALGGMRILDIGAGYGRMAHRMLTRYPELPKYTCTDSVAESTYLCDFYLRHRGLRDRAEVLPLDQVVANDAAFAEIDLAINIHSFSECPYAAIAWWLSRLPKGRPLKMLIVPNDPQEFLATEADGTKRDFLPLLEQHGFRLQASEPVFPNPDIRELVKVQDHLFLFSRD